MSEKQLSEKPEILVMVSSDHLMKSVTKLLDDSFQINSALTDHLAWENLQNSALPALIICDLDLAFGELAILGRIRQSSSARLAATPVLVLVTEHNSDEDRDAAISSGATDFINVPFSSSELITRAKLHAQIMDVNASGNAAVSAQAPAIRAMNHLISENLFISRLEQEISFSQRHNSYISVAKIRIDGLSEILKEKGKTNAIEVVKAISGLIQKTARSEDIISYIGKGRYFLLYPATNGIGATIALKRISQKLKLLEINLEGGAVSPTVSVGIVSSFVDEKITNEIILRAVEKRLNEAISNGGNCVINQNLSGQKSELSIDSALRMIENEQIENLKPYLKNSALRVLPLIESAVDEFDIDSQNLIDLLKQQLAGR